MKRVSGIFLLILALLSGCKYAGLVYGEYTPPASALISVSIPLEEAYSGSMTRIDLVIQSGATGETTTLPMTSNILNTQAVSDDFELENGNYSAYVILEKEWDDDNGCALYMQTPVKIFLFEGRDLELAFDNPWLTGTQEVFFHVDVATMIDGGVTPDFAGIWLQSVRESGEEPDYHYHFHLQYLSGSTLSGSFYMQPGEYTVEVIPENFDHPDWTDDTSWHPELSAGNINKDCTVGTSIRDIVIETTHYMEFRFDGVDSCLIPSANGGTLEYVDGSLHLKANGSESVPSTVLSDDIALEDNIFLQFDLTPGTYDLVLNGENPYLLINMLIDNESDSRVSVSLEKSEILFQSLVDGIQTDEQIWMPTGGWLSEGVSSTFTLFLKNSNLYLYSDTSGSPLYVYEYSEGVPESGGFSLYCFQEMYLNTLLFVRDIKGGMDLTGSGDTSSGIVTGILLEEDFTLGTEQFRQIDYTFLPASPDNTGISWESSDTGIVTVDSSGGVTAGVSAGSAEITATTDDGGYKDTLVVNVEAYVAVSGLSFGTPPSSLEVNEEADITISIQPGSATNQDYTVTIDDPAALALVDKGGTSFKIRGLSTSAGVGVTVTSDDDPSIYDSFSVTVSNDSQAPWIQELFAVDNKTLYVAFSETMDNGGSLSTGNYSLVRNPSGVAETLTVSSITRVSDDSLDSKTILYLYIDETLLEGDVVELTGASPALFDLAGNALSTDVLTEVGRPGNVLQTQYVASHGLAVTPGDLYEEDGQISVLGGTESIYPAGSNWVPSEGQYLVIGANAVLSETSILAEGVIGTYGASLDHDANVSPLLWEDSILVFKNGEYLIYMMFLYDLDGDFTGTTDDKIMVFGDPAAFTVTTGL